MLGVGPFREMSLERCIVKLLGLEQLAGVFHHFRLEGEGPNALGLPRKLCI